MLVVANWKAYVEDIAKAKKLYSIAKRLSKTTKVEVVLAPSSPQLGLFAPKNKSKVHFAAQDVSATTGGPETGEVSAPILASLGISYVIVGHSERRAHGESSATIATKLQHAIAHGLTPILCVGEKERDTEGRYLAAVREQIDSALTPLDPKDRAKVIVAYEPVWLIGKSTPDSTNDVAEMALYIRKVLAELLPGKRAQKTTVIYGAAVEPQNIRGLAGGSGVDGFLVGHASADPKMFAAIIQALA